MTRVLRACGLLAVCAVFGGCQRHAGEPYAEAPYFFGKAGVAREFSVRTHAFRSPEVALLMEPGTFSIPTDRKAPPLSGKVSAAAYQSGRLVETFTLEPKAYWHNGRGRVHSISLGAFEKLGVFPRETRVVIKVHEPMNELGQINPAVKVVLRASPIP